MLDKDDILAHTLDMVPGGKIDTYPIIAVIQGRDLTYPEWSDYKPEPTVMVITHKPDNTFDVWWIALSDTKDTFPVSHYGNVPTYPQALIMAAYQATGD